VQVCAFFALHGEHFYDTSSRYYFLPKERMQSLRNAQDHRHSQESVDYLNPEMPETSRTNASLATHESSREIDAPPHVGYLQPDLGSTLMTKQQHTAAPTRIGFLQPVNEVLTRNPTGSIKEPVDYLNPVENSRHRPEADQHAAALSTPPSAEPTTRAPTDAPSTPQPTLVPRPPTHAPTEFVARLDKERGFAFGYSSGTTKLADLPP
jgi:hypothetical protein